MSPLDVMEGMNEEVPSVWKGSAGVRISKDKFDVDRLDEMFNDKS